MLVLWLIGEAVDVGQLKVPFVDLSMQNELIPNG